MSYGCYIGIPFEWGGRGPKSYDCWGLVRELYQTDHQIVLPDYLGVTNPNEIASIMTTEKSAWRRFDDPVEKSVALIARNGLWSHVGYVISERHFLHTWEASGGVTRAEVKRWWYRIEGFYQYVG